MKNSGFTLLEVMIASALLTIISLLGFVALQSSARAVNVNQAVALVEADARNVLRAIMREVEFAVKPAAVGATLPPDVQGLQVHDNNRAVTFQTPTNAAFTTFSAPITFRFETEDTPLAVPGFEFGNAVLDPGEDVNNDGVLNRRVLRIQGGETQVLGSANTIADARFELLEGNTVLRITIVATTRIEPLQQRLTRHELQGDVYLMN